MADSKEKLFSDFIAPTRQEWLDKINVDLKGVFAVGDSLRDLEAAVTAGALPILVLTGKGEKTLAEGNLPAGTLVFNDLAAAVEHILRT